MCAKTFKKRGKVVPRYTLRTLTCEDIDSPVHKEQRRQFVASVISCLGPAATTGYFPEDHGTPMYEQYSENEDGQEGMDDDPPEWLAPTPEVGYTYVNIELMLPHGSNLSKERVTGHKRDAVGQVCGQTNNITF